MSSIHSRACCARDRRGQGGEIVDRRVLRAHRGIGGVDRGLVEQHAVRIGAQLARSRNSDRAARLRHRRRHAPGRTQLRAVRARTPAPTPATARRRSGNGRDESASADLLESAPATPALAPSPGRIPYRGCSRATQAGCPRERGQGNTTLRAPAWRRRRPHGRARRCRTGTGRNGRVWRAAPTAPRGSAGSTGRTRDTTAPSAMPSKLLCEARIATTKMSSALAIFDDPGKRASGVCATTRPSTVAIMIVHEVALTYADSGSTAASARDTTPAPSARPSHSSTASNVIGSFDSGTDDRDVGARLRARPAIEGRREAPDAKTAPPPTSSSKAHRSAAPAPSIVRTMPTPCITATRFAEPPTQLPLSAASGCHAVFAGKA